MAQRPSLLRLTLVCITILAQIDFVVCWWNCYQDACNVDGTEQYCSEVDKKCRNCKEIVDICLTKDMPFNCSKTCDEYIREQERASSCPALGDIENGRRREEISSISRPGDAVHFSCDPGFKLEGSSDLMCKACGQWSGTVPVCEAIACPPLSNISNGDISGSSLKHLPGTEVTVKCAAGYRLIGKDTITCGPDGRWSSAPPICLELTCPKPPVVSHGQWSTGSKEKFSTGHIIGFNCTSGFTLEGSSVWNCSGGTWVSTSALSDHIPVCTKAVSNAGRACPVPVKVLNGMWSTDTEHPIALVCAEDFTLEGSALWTCENGTWVSASGTQTHFPVCAKADDNTVYIAIIAIISSVAAILVIWVAVLMCRQHKKKSGYNEVPTVDKTISLNRMKKVPRPNLCGYEEEDELLKEKDQFGQHLNETVLDNNNILRRSGEQPKNDACVWHENKESKDTTSNNVNVSIAIHTNENSRVSMSNSNSNVSNMSDSRRPLGDSNLSDNDQMNDDETQDKGAIPQQPEKNLKFPVAESQHNVTGPKYVSPDDHKDATGGAQTGFVQQQGTEQDLNQKMAVGGTEFHVGDQNGANNAPDDVISKQITVVS